MAELVFYGHAAVGDCTYRGAIVCVCESSSLIFDPITSELMSEISNSQIWRKSATEALCLAEHVAFRADPVCAKAFFGCISGGGFDYPCYRVTMEGAQYQLFVLWDRMLFYRDEKVVRTDLLKNISIYRIDYSLLVLSIEISYQIYTSGLYVSEELFSLLNFLVFLARRKPPASLGRSVVVSTSATPAAKIEVLHELSRHNALEAAPSYVQKTAVSALHYSQSYRCEKQKTQQNLLPSGVSESCHRNVPQQTQGMAKNYSPGKQLYNAEVLRYEYQVSRQNYQLKSSPTYIPTLQSLYEAVAMVENKNIRVEAGGRRALLRFRVNNGLFVNFQHYLYKITALASTHNDEQSATVAIEPLNQEFKIANDDLALLQKCFEIIHRAEMYGVLR